MMNEEKIAELVQQLENLTGEESNDVLAAIAALEQSMNADELFETYTRIGLLDPDVLAAMPELAGKSKADILTYFMELGQANPHLLKEAKDELAKMNPRFADAAEKLVERTGDAENNRDIIRKTAETVYVVPPTRNLN